MSGISCAKIGAPTRTAPSANHLIDPIFICIFP
jgi:hypothetical protein